MDDSVGAGAADAVLCYVSGSCAWFTTCSLKDQWGDDWNDRPYEYNAGDPYDWAEHRGIPAYELMKVFFDGDLETPDFNYVNSPYSVEDINKGAVPWLTDTRGNCWPAGVTLKDFVTSLRGLGYGVYLDEKTWRLLS